MTSIVASAIFDSLEDAEQAVSELRSSGISDNAISIIGSEDGKAVDTGNAGNTSKREAVTGVLAGAGTGTLLGIAALAIPGIGPFVAAGAIAALAIPEAALMGAVVGGAAVGLTSLLTKHGVNDEDSRYYERHIKDGGVFVSIHAGDAGMDPEQAREILYRHGGHSAARARSSTT